MYLAETILSIHPSMQTPPFLLGALYNPGQYLLSPCIGSLKECLPDKQDVIEESSTSPPLLLPHQPSTLTSLLLPHQPLPDGPLPEGGGDEGGWAAPGAR